MPSQNLTYRFPRATLCATLISVNLLAAPKDVRVGVSDGDTITVLLDHIPTRVRLWDIDCPEAKQPFGNRAEPFTSNLSFGKTVRLQPMTTDRYGRPVAVVILPNGSNLNDRVVRAGFGWFRRFAPRARELD